MTDPQLLPVNEKVDDAVRQYVDGIVSAVENQSPNTVVDVMYEDTCNKTETERASIACVASELAIITIFPDFVNQSAAAAVMNRGMMQAMVLEGFSDEDVDNAPLYSALVPLNEVDSFEMLAVLLTKDLGMQHQKQLEAQP